MTSQLEMIPRVDSLNQESNPKGHETLTAWEIADEICPFIIITFGAYVEKQIHPQTMQLFRG